MQSLKSYPGSVPPSYADPSYALTIKRLRDAMRRLGWLKVKSVGRFEVAVIDWENDDTQRMIRFAVQALKKEVERVRERSQNTADLLAYSVDRIEAKYHKAVEQGGDLDSCWQSCLMYMPIAATFTLAKRLESLQDQAEQTEE